MALVNQVDDVTNDQLMTTPYCLVFEPEFVGTPCTILMRQLFFFDHENQGGTRGPTQTSFMTNDFFFEHNKRLQIKNRTLRYRNSPKNPR